MTNVTPAASSWPCDQLATLYYANVDTWVAVSDDFADNMREAVPPVFVPGGFLVGEPFSHNADGRPVRLAVAYVKGAPYARYCTKADYAGLFRALAASLNVVEA
jgi:hypothetical protein